VSQSVQITRTKFWEDLVASLSTYTYDEASKLLMIANADRFLRLISISTNPVYVKCDRYNFKVMLVDMFVIF
jgi:hypothetical protein